MSDYLRSFLQSEVVKEEVFEKHKPDCQLIHWLSVYKNDFSKALSHKCTCAPEPYERIVIERPVGLVVEAKERE